MTISPCEANRQVNAIGGEHYEPGAGGMGAVARVLGVDGAELRAGAFDQALADIRCSGIADHQPTREELLAFTIVVYEAAFLAGVVHERASG